MSEQTRWEGGGEHGQGVRGGMGRVKGVAY